MVLKGNAIVAQSGGPSPVINNSICGVIQTWFKEADFGTIYAGISGIKGILEGNIIDLKEQREEDIAGCVILLAPVSFLAVIRSVMMIRSS